MKVIIAAIFMIINTVSAFAQVPDKPEDIAPLLIGETVPRVMVTSPENKSLNIGDIVAQKPTVLLIYRGGWCPYCNLHLSDIQNIEKDIRNKGYQIVAISPDAPQNLKVTENEKGIHYSLYSDSKTELIRAMGLAFKAPQSYLGIVNKSSDGMNSNILPVPAVFVLDTSGKIVFEYINPDFKTRISGKLLMAILKNL